MLSAPEAAGLEFQVKHDVVLFCKFEDFFQGWNAFAHEFACKPGTRVQPTRFRKRHFMNRAAAVCGALYSFVVDRYEVSIAGQVQIGFDEGDSLRNRASKSSEGIFGRVP